MEQKTALGLIGAFIILIVLSASIFTVHEREKALVLRLGKISASDFEPGLQFKIPFVETVEKFDGRVMTLDAPPERYLTAEKKNVIVDSFVKWKIIDEKEFFVSMGGDRVRANERLSEIVKQELRDQFGRRTLRDVVSGEREKVMKILTVNTNESISDFGIEVVDFRIKRIDLPEEVSVSVYRRMEAERARVAKDLRSRGAEAAERIRADADRQRTVLLAEAYGDAERLRGEGDARAADIYATAYTADAEFYAFYRSLLAYKSSFNNSGNMMVLEPNTDFFKYFKNPKGGMN
ncbi:HflC protein [hydrothermal vent metagenome]|uniref:HflC protein n=1 Tax=hydrothermal vent metagenome TaxID=652676 RepID=A0A3B0Z8C0_9ZZZZ